MQVNYVFPISVCSCVQAMSVTMAYLRMFGVALVVNEMTAFVQMRYLEKRALRLWCLYDGMDGHYHSQQLTPEQIDAERRSVQTQLQCVRERSFVLVPTKLLYHASVHTKYE